MDKLLLDISSKDLFNATFIEKVSGRLSINKTQVKKDGKKKSKKRFEGEEIIVESAHPYSDSSDEYKTIQVDRAIAYEIVFDNQTCTEPNYDFLTLFKDDSHTDFWGENKYTGGRGGSTRNYPGIEDRPPLTVSAEKFVVYFHSDGSGNDWGYKMTITPILSGPPENPPIPLIDANDLADVYLTSDFTETSSADIYGIVKGNISEEDSDLLHDNLWQMRKTILESINAAISVSAQGSSTPASADGLGGSTQSQPFDWISASESLSESPNDVVMATSISASLAAIAGLEGDRQRVAVDRLCVSLTRVFSASLPSLTPLSRFWTHIHTNCGLALTSNFSSYSSTVEANSSPAVSTEEAAAAKLEDLVSQDLFLTESGVGLGISPTNGLADVTITAATFGGANVLSSGEGIAQALVYRFPVDDDADSVKSAYIAAYYSADNYTKLLKFELSVGEDGEIEAKALGTNYIVGDKSLTAEDAVQAWEEGQALAAADTDRWKAVVATSLSGSGYGLFGLQGSVSGVEIVKPEELTTEQQKWLT